MLAVVILACIEATHPADCTPINYASLVRVVQVDACAVPLVFQVLKTTRPPGDGYYHRAHCVTDDVRKHLESERV